MRRFEDILCVFDGAIGANAAFERARRLARQNAARLTIMHCVEGEPCGDDSDADPEMMAVLNTARQDWHHQLEILSDAARADGTRVRIAICIGIPFLEIIRQVLDNGHDLVIKTAQSIRATKELLFGSTDMHLMRKCPCPVWVEKEATLTRYRRILAAVDVARDRPAERLLSRLIMDLATSLATTEGAALDVLHVDTPPGEAHLRTKSLTQRGSKHLEARVQAKQSARNAAFEGLIAPYRRSSAGLAENFISGDPAVVIPDFAATHAVDLIVMGSVGRSDIAGLLMGNAAEDVLRQVNCAVLTIKPSDFASPIRRRH